jgi:motility quorum-sensing regulator/GCU-specific mRNA interferase toxin
LEKRIAHYSLIAIKELIGKNKYFVTLSARQGYTELGMSDDDMLEVIQKLTSKNLYKSMTSYNNHQLWQDVYHSTFNGIALYVKLQMKENAIIISFKER